MSRRSGFTLVEALVAFTLVLFIMVILTEAFGASLKAFRDLKALGDMEERLRGAAGVLRRDLEADHFEGRRRLSDPPNSWGHTWPPRPGFFRLALRPNSSTCQSAAEGQDADGLASRRGTRHVLHFSVKLRGNDRKDFFTAAVPNNSPLRTSSTTFYGLPADARYQDGNGTYVSQWAEVA